MEEILINKVWVAGDGKYVTNDMQAMRLYSFAHLAPEKRPCWGFQVRLSIVPHHVHAHHPTCV